MSDLKITETKLQRSMTESRLLPYELTDEEINALGREISEIVQEKTKLEIEKKEVTSSYSSKIKGLESKIKGRAKKVIEGKEDRQIECTVIYNEPKYGTKTVTRLDTFDTWEEPMNEDELTNLFFNSDGKSEEE